MTKPPVQQDLPTQGVVATRYLLIGVFGMGLVAGVLLGPLGQGWTLLPYLAFAVIGIVLTARRPENLVGWLFLVNGALAGLVGLQSATLQIAVHRGDAGAGYALVAAWLSNMTFLPLLVASTSLVLLVFPDGLPSRRWRWVWRALIASTLGLVGVFALTPELITADGAIHPNPLHPTPWGVVLSAVTLVLVLALLVLSLAAVGSVVVRYRRSSGLERAQIRWLAFAAVILLVALTITALLPTDSLLSNAVFTMGATLVPVAVGLAILRYQLYEIDRIISRTTSYAIVTGMLIAIYVVVVTATTSVVSDAPTLAVAAATLAAASAARPLLRRVQSLVDQRFNRSRFDARVIVDSFGAQLRNETDPERVGDALRGAVTETLQPTGMSLHLLRAP